MKGNTGGKSLLVVKDRHAQALVDFLGDPGEVLLKV